MNTYDIGDQVRVSVAFTDSLGVATDPTTVTARYRSLDDGLPTSFTYPTAIVKDSVGAYHLDIGPTESGWYSYRFAGTGALIAAAEGQFFVRPTLS